MPRVCPQPRSWTGVRGRRLRTCVHHRGSADGHDTIVPVTESGRQTPWSCPEGSVGHDESVKGYSVEATDGQVGTVSWASYAPGESYLVVSYRDGHHEVHTVVR